MKNFTFNINENSYSVKILGQEENTIELEVNGTCYKVKMKEEIKSRKTPTLIRKPSNSGAVEPVKVNPTSTKLSITAPLPGLVMSVNVKVGDMIKENDLLIVLEAMKMENNIVAETSGKVGAIHVQSGQQVLQGQVLIEFE